MSDLIPKDEDALYSSSESEEEIVRPRRPATGTRTAAARSGGRSAPSQRARRTNVSYEEKTLVTHIAKITIPFHGSLNDMKEDTNQKLTTFSINPQIFLTNKKKSKAVATSTDDLYGSTKSKKGKRGKAAPLVDGGDESDDDDEAITADDLEKDPNAVTIKKLKRVMITKMKLLGYQNTYPFILVLKLKGVDGKYGNDDTGILLYADATHQETKDLEYTNYAINPELIQHYGHLTQRDLLKGLIATGETQFLVPVEHECVPVLMENSLRLGKQLFATEITKIPDPHDPSAPKREFYVIDAEMVHMANDLLMRKVIMKMPTVDMTKLEARLQRYAIDDKALMMHSTMFTECEGLADDSSKREAFMAKKHYCVVELQIEYQTWEKTK